MEKEDFPEEKSPLLPSLSRLSEVFLGGGDELFSWTALYAVTRKFFSGTKPLCPLSLLLDPPRSSFRDLSVKGSSSISSAFLCFSFPIDEPIWDALESGGLGFGTGLGRGDLRLTTTDWRGLLRAGLLSRGLRSETEARDAEPAP